MRGGSNFPMRDQRPVAHCFIRNATIPGLSQEARNPSAFPAKPRVLPVQSFATGRSRSILTTDRVGLLILRTANECSHTQPGALAPIQFTRRASVWYPFFLSPLPNLMLPIFIRDLLVRDPPEISCIFVTNLLVTRLK
ncbi:hypothetical protein G5I_10201 [Acromyrmex echinatior]|uniref:Uncharacterized protein n=1 Tax=Acromyrmex echinatior TaxID=103372 RepID=F4WW47_ACREC|nr:hypothetical protein G5I_10201 [Acromyrmex echinatior]